MATSSGYQVKIVVPLELIDGSTNAVWIKWSYTKDTEHLDHFKVVWYEKVKKSAGGTTWTTLSSETIAKGDRFATHTASNSNVIAVAVEITPIAKYKDKKKTTRYWTGTKVGGKTKENTYYAFKDNPVTIPPTPSLTTDQLNGVNRLVMTINDYLDSNVDKVQFYIAKVVSGDLKKVDTSPELSYSTSTSLRNVSYIYKSAEGNNTYTVRVRARNKNTNDWSSYSSFSEQVKTAPSITAELAAPVLETLTTHTVRVNIEKTYQTMSYEVAYVTDEEDWGTSKQTSVSVDAGIDHVDIEVGDSGATYYFRYRRVNESGYGAWSTVSSVKLGIKPSPPTTWESDTVVMIGSKFKLYWIHNSTDNSRETAYKIQTTLNGTELPLITGTDDEEKDPYISEKTHSYEIDTSSGTTYTGGGVFTWKVSTKGTIDTYSEWSTVRTINIYEQPTVALSVVDGEGTAIEKCTSLPLNVKTTHTPNSQKPLSYYLQLQNVQSYTTSDMYGNDVFVDEGTIIFSRTVDTNEDLSEVIGAEDLTLSDGITYILSVEVGMDSGLRASSTYTFSTDFADQTHVPDGNITIDKDYYTALITAWCRDDQTGECLDDILLSIYRQNADGSFVSVQENIENDATMHILDAHPNLNIARYRVTAKDKTTGTVQYVDIDEYVGETAAVITWNEETPNDRSSDTDDYVWSGTILKLPYNLDITDTGNVDSSLVEYIGRKHPVSYYGTQVGMSSSWKSDIPKSDTDTLDLIRLLQAQTGDVYVREPYGTGYPAKVDVSYNIKYNTMVIPVTLTITRTDANDKDGLKAKAHYQIINYVDNVTNVDFEVNNEGYLVMDKGNGYSGTDYLITGQGEIGVEV